MNSLPKLNYNWNWAEAAEAEEQAILARQRLMDANPDLPTLLMLLNQPFSIRPPIALDSRIPSGIPDTIEGLTAIGCALLNNDHEACQQWVNWFFSSMQSEAKIELTYSALCDIIKKTGSLHLIPPPNLDQALTIAKPHANFTAFSSNALAIMFQPKDCVPVEFEETPYLPSCKILLTHGALPSYRTPNGSTALSGINFRLAEAEISMAEPAKISDLLSCAELIMASGGSTDDVREMPPLEQVVPNKHLYGILVSAEEKTKISESLTITSTLKPNDSAQGRKRL